ncbi:MAG: zinc ABC transporter substrate-binding protein [Magnetococcus sp. YQC-3]
MKVCSRFVGFWVCLLLWIPAIAAANSPLRVVTSFTILADMVQQVGGDAVTVKSLVGPNGDAHRYEPTPMDAQAILAADCFVVNGLGFEGWMERLVNSSSFRGTLVTASQGTTPLLMAGNGQPDPHAWQDVASARVYVGNIAEALLRLAPQRAEAIRANAARFDGELAELDQWVRSQFATIPVARRKIITSHDAFGHFARAYGVTFLSPMGASSDAEPSAKGVAKLIVQARQEGIRGIFMENIENPRLLQQLAREAGLTLGGTLHADALSTAEGPAPTYAAMIRRNVTLLRGAMAGGE